MREYELTKVVAKEPYLIKKQTSTEGDKTVHSEVEPFILCNGKRFYFGDYVYVLNIYNDVREYFAEGYIVDIEVPSDVESTSIIDGIKSGKIIISKDKKYYMYGNGTEWGVYGTWILDTVR